MATHLSRQRSGQPHSDNSSDAPGGQAPAGRHLLADLYGLPAEPLRDEQALMARLIAALERAGFHLVGRQSHKFPGAGGVTGVVLLSESHAAFHSYPEHGYLAVDVFSCGQARPEEVLEALAADLGPATVRTAVHNRGSHR